jgi:hypothetical protein
VSNLEAPTPISFICTSPYTTVNITDFTAFRTSVTGDLNGNDANNRHRISKALTIAGCRADGIDV